MITFVGQSLFAGIHVPVLRQYLSFGGGAGPLPGVAVAQRLETCLEARAVVELAASHVAVEVAFVDAGGNERVALQVETRM